MGVAMYVRVPGGEQDGFDPWMECPQCGDWIAPDRICVGCDRFAVGRNPTAIEGDDGSLTIQGCGKKRIGFYPSGAWISWRTA
jgi:hypothetical protein